MIFSYYYLDFLLILREIFFIFIVIFSICVYTLLEKIFKKKYKEISLFYSVCLYFIMLFNIYLISALSYIKTYYYLFNYSISNIYGIDFFKIILVILIILIFYAAISDKSFRLFKYIPFESNYILSFVFIGMLFLLYSFDFLIIFLNLELQNFSLYILMNIQRNKKIVVETCIKYYIIGGLSSASILYGISLIYGFTGKVNLFDLILFFSEIRLIHFGFIIGFIFLFLGLFIKIGIAPFHFWVPQIYEGAPHFVTLILLILPKFVLFILFVKLYFFIFKFLNNILCEFLWLNVFLSFFFGSLGALWQNNIKKFLAYSAINNSGFILLAFSLSTFESNFAGILYLIIYLFSTFAIFYSFLIISPKQFNSYNLLEFKNFSTLKIVNPLFVFILSINFLSIAGIPPLSGFISKFFIFVSVLELNYLIILFILILVSLVSAYYYIRPVKLLLFHIKFKPKFLVEISFFSGIILVLIFFFNLFLILQPRLLFFFIENIFTYEFLNI